MMYYAPLAPNFHLFRSTVSGFGDKYYFDLCDLEMTLKGQMRFSAPIKHISYDIVYLTGPKFSSFSLYGEQFWR